MVPRSTAFRYKGATPTPQGGGSSRPSAPTGKVPSAATRTVRAERGRKANARSERPLVRRAAEPSRRGRDRTQIAENLRLTLSVDDGAARPPSDGSTEGITCISRDATTGATHATRPAEKRLFEQAIAGRRLRSRSRGLAPLRSHAVFDIGRRPSYSQGKAAALRAYSTEKRLAEAHAELSLALGACRNWAARGRLRRA